MNQLNKKLPSIYLYGMPINRIDDTIYGGLFGNATRAVGLALNLAKIGHEVFLEVEDDFQNDVKNEILPTTLSLIYSKDRSTILEKTDVLVISCTNLESFGRKFGREAYLFHKCRYIASCFDLNQKIDLGRLELTTQTITFNNDLQQQKWLSRKSLISSKVIPYGVNERLEVDEAITSNTGPSAIWIGMIRRIDVLERIIRFATINPECRVTVATRTIFDSEIPDGEFGSMTRPYADFTGRDLITQFGKIATNLCGLAVPKNLDFIGPAEGLNHVLQGQHIIGLDFSRFPAQTHDNTKIMDYLRSGLAVICDKGTPSYRFVEETQHGVVLPEVFSDLELRDAYLRCLDMADKELRKKTAKYMAANYGWDQLAKMHSLEICRAASLPRRNFMELKLSSIRRACAAVIQKCNRIMKQTVRKLKNER